MLNQQAHRAFSLARGERTTAPDITESRVDIWGHRSDPSQEVGLRQHRTDRLKPLTIRRLINLLEQGGELPSHGEKGVLLPPFDVRFLGDELGCRPSQVHALLEELVVDGLVVCDAGRFRVPEPARLRAMLPPQRASPG